MISFEQAYELAIQHAPRMEAELCCLENAAGRVLRQDVAADRNFPPYDRVMMDGYALRRDEIMAGQRIFSVDNHAPAGQEQVSMSADTLSCIAVMTGAVLPMGADCIVPIERTMRDGDHNIKVEEAFKTEAGQFIHDCGSDARKGDLLLRSGILLGAREIGVAASCGVHQLLVSRLPRIAVIPTGDELVEVTAKPALHEIRQSNGHAICAALTLAGYATEIKTSLKDDGDHDGLWDELRDYDWLIFTGAVSKGIHDFLPAWFEKHSCEKIFHGVAQRPGKPMGFWRGLGGQAILALPGNPVSAITGLHSIALPALEAGLMLDARAKRLVIPAQPLTGLQNMTHHLPVKIGVAGRAHAAACGNSGDFIGLLHSDGFVSIPADATRQMACAFTPWI